MLFFAGLGLAMFIEGLPYFISPPAVRRYLKSIEQMSDVTLRALGFAMMVAGLVVIFLATR
jgi:uncharacterized protein YjeT (DUF2065 family)